MKNQGRVSYTGLRKRNNFENANVTIFDVTALLIFLKHFMEDIMHLFNVLYDFLGHPTSQT